MSQSTRTYGWPVYFAARALDAKRVKLKAGEPFPNQDKAVIRGLAKSYGRPEASDVLTVPFGKLDFVKVLDVGTLDVAQKIVSEQIPYAEARKLVGGTANGS